MYSTKRYFAAEDISDRIVKPGDFFENGSVDILETEFFQSGKIVSEIVIAVDDRLKLQTVSYSDEASESASG